MNIAKNSWTLADYRVAAIVMTLMGGYYWAIRGTTGYGGETGGMLAGFGWALFWYGFSRTGDGAFRRAYGQPWIVPAITFGIALGGFTGYGVYISWLRGLFFLNYPEGMRDVPAWTGYGMLFLCGLHWGGNTGCFMAWCAPKRPLRVHDWVLRIAFGVGGAVGAAVFVRLFPQLFLPFYNEGLYGAAENKTCVRALDSIHTIAPHVGLLLGFLAYEILRRDWRAVGIILTMALGFAIPFAAGGYWQTFNDSELKLSWWKNWEMTIGLGGGLAFGLAFWLFNRPGDQQQHSFGPKSRFFFLSGIPLFPAVVMVFKGAYEGWCEIYGHEPTLTGYAVILLLSGAPMALVWFAYGRLPDASGGPLPRFLGWRSIAAYQLLIVLMGLSVSIPVKWQLANTVLMACYSLYIGGSAVLLWMFWRRMQPLQIPGEKR